MTSWTRCSKHFLFSRTIKSSSLRTRRYSSKTDVSSATTNLPKPRLDYRAISESIVYKSHNAFNRKAILPVGAVQSVARVYTELKEVSATLNAKRNARSVVGERIRRSADAKEKEAAMEEAKQLKKAAAELETKLADLEDQLLTLALAIPNDTHPSSPLGPESAAVILSTHGPAPIPASPARDHVSIGRALGLIDLEAGATVTGSSWYYLLNEGALLETALTNYALSIALKHGFSTVTTPDVVRLDIAQRCGFQPRDQTTDPPSSQMYHISNHASSPSSHNHPELVLAGTAEIPLAGLFANKLLPPKSLPLKVVGLGRSFRAEAGARGTDTRGLYRVHQFTKLELFVVAEEEQSEAVMEDIRKVQVEIYEGLGFPFRVLDMPTEELGASAYRKYDMEAWMPGRGGWGEISSTSNCTDYQARRLHIRYRRSTPPATTLPSSSSPPASPYHTAGLPFAHTLNGTAAAIPRLIVALIENGTRFDENGNPVGLDLPSILQQFWVGGNGKRDLIRWI